MMKYFIYIHQQLFFYTISNENNLLTLWLLCVTCCPYRSFSLLLSTLCYFLMAWVYDIHSRKHGYTVIRYQQTIIARQYGTPDINCTALPILIPAHNTYFIILRRKDNYNRKLWYARYLKNILSNLRPIMTMLFLLLHACIF